MWTSGGPASDVCACVSEAAEDAPVSCGDAACSAGDTAMATTSKMLKNFGFTRGPFWVLGPADS